MSREQSHWHMFRPPPYRPRGPLVRFWDRVKKEIGPSATLIAALIAGTIALTVAFYTQQYTAEISDRKDQSDALRAYITEVGNIEATEDQTQEENRRSRAQSLTSKTQVLSTRLNPDNKRILVQFLSQEGLISREDPIVSLAGADLTYANLSSGPRGGVSLESASLKQANLYQADLKSAYLGNADLSDATLEGADLSNADVVSNTDLSNADLQGANLYGADLSNANLSAAQLGGAVLRNATLRAANLTDADFSGESPWPERDDLRTPHQRLEGADLSNAILTNVQGISFPLLIPKAGSLEGAVRPDGKLHEMFPWWKRRWWVDESP